MTWIYLLLAPAFLHYPAGIYVRLGGSLPAQPTAAQRASLQGLQLLAAHLQKHTPFYGPSQLPLRLQLELKDGGDPSEVSEIYSKFAANDEADFLVSLDPISSEAAAAVGNAQGMLTLLTGSESESGPWTFTPDVQVRDMMAGTLDLAGRQPSPARSIATIWDAESPFAETLCAGAGVHAERIGMKVLDATGIADQAVMPHMRHLKAMGPDVLVGCGNLRSAEQILISASSLSFVPLGLVLTAVSSRDAVRSVGAHLANFVMSPVVWEPSASLRCRVFGSALDFAAAYRAKFEEEPLPESAAAAAGAMALLAAIQEVSSLEQSAVREALLRLSLQTCYGKLSFDSNGTRRDPETLTQQVQPLDKDRATMDRWTSAEIVTLGEGEGRLSGWPLPTWVQKEIDVYPCIPGEAVVLDTAGNASTCKQCPIGQYRTPRSVECEDCQPGTYGLQLGLSQCDVCPFGADCPGNSQVFAKPGFYRLPTSSQSGTFVKCNPPELCLGMNSCTEAHQGILCQYCSPGYALPLWGMHRDFCMKCPSHRVAVGSIALTVCLYVLYVWLIVKGTRSASQSVRAIHSVILKISVNYLQFAGTAFEATEFKVVVATICGESASFIIPFIDLPERLQYPFTALMSLDCILPPGSSIRPYQVEIAVGLIMMPAAFFIMTLWAAIRKDCIGVLVPWLRRRWALHKARCRARTLELGLEDTPDTQDDVARMPRGPSPTSPGQCNQDAPSSPSLSPKRRFGASPTLSPLSPVSPQRRRGGGDFTPMSAYGLTSPSRRRYRSEDSPESPSPKQTHPKVFVNNVATRFVNSVIVMSFILHPVVVRILVVGFECEELDVLRHRRDFSVECKSDSHMPWLALSTAGLVVFGLGVPVSLFIALYRVRKYLYRPEIRKRYGFLYNGFELKYYYFEPVYMFRKVMILLFFTAPTMYVRMVLMLFTSFGFILLHVYTGPFDNRSYMCLDRLETLSLTALTATVSARLIFDIRQELSGEFFEEVVNHWTMDILLVAGPLLPHLAFFWFAIWALFRNTVLKHLLLKADIWPGRMSAIQKCLLGLERHKQKAYFDEDAEGLWLDTGNLSQQEKDFLFVAMCDTLHRYMDTEQRIRPSDMAAAVREAIIRCRCSRRKRAVRLEQLDREHRENRAMGRTNCLSRIIRWQRVLSVSLYGADRQSELQEQESSSCVGSLLSCWKGKPDPLERRVRGLPKQALHMEMERTQEFLPEEFFDALLPVWQEITEGQGPRFSFPEQQYTWPATYLAQRPRLRVRLQGVEDEGEEEDDVERADHTHSSLHGSTIRLEALLGRGQAPADRQESGPLESFLSRAQSGCRIDLPDLIQAHDKLLAENLELHKENEVLRARITPSPFSGLASPKASPKSQGAQLSRCSSQDEFEEGSAPEARSNWREASAMSPSIVTMAAAAFATARSSSSASVRSEGSLGEEPSASALPTALAAKDISEVKSPAARSQASRSPSRRTQGLLLLPLQSAAERARAMYREATSPSISPAGSSPWRNAMRPVRRKEWSDAQGTCESALQRHVPFEFSGAVRPTDPDAWPQVE